VAKEKANLKAGGVAPRIGTLGPTTGTNLLRTLPPTGTTTTLMTLLAKEKKGVKGTLRVKAVARIGLVTFPAVTMALTLISLMITLLNTPFTPLSGTLGRIQTRILILALPFLILRTMSLTTLCMLSLIYTS
jgi:hypothetical protein